MHSAVDTCISLHVISCISVNCVMIAVQQCPDSLAEVALPYLAAPAITGTELTAATPTPSPFFSSSSNDSLKEKYVLQFGEIHFVYFEKYILQFGQIHHWDGTNGSHSHSIALLLLFH